MDELLSQFLIEARELIAQAGDDFEWLARDPADSARIDSAFRAIHTLKGSVAIFDMVPAGRALHAAEDVLDRARAGRHRLGRTNVDALVAVLDQTDRWVDAMERDGALSPRAGAEADALLARLQSNVARPPKLPAAETPPWLPALLAREAAAIEAAASDLVAFRYNPDSECFFRGEDPLATVAALPGIAALAILPNAAWPAIDAFEPFQCMVTIEGLSAAAFDDVRTAFRFVADQVMLFPVAAARAAEAEIQTAAAKSLRIDTARIDALADGVGELIVANNALAHVAAEADRVDPQIGAQVRAAHAALERAVSGMRRSVMTVRLVSLGPSLRRLPRMVREIAATLGKPVRFEISGEGIEVDKGIADELFEPLLHLVRNALDHGIEPGVVRRKAGKPETGLLRLAVTREGDQVVVALTDDGAGIDTARVRAIAVERGLLDRDAAAALDEMQAMRLIFAPGFSTAATVSAVSGRGVGMDAVKAAIDRLGGRVEIGSVLGRGTTIRLRLPLNAILTRLLIVRAGGERYGIPLDRIVETTSIPTEHIHDVGGGRSCVLRDRAIPVLSLAALLGAEDRRSPFTKLIVTENAAEPVGVIVDGFGQRIDGLVRPKTGLMAGVRGLAGTTTLGDGGVLLVLDLAELVA
ncbi:chemotaxis protein CheA [Sphingomonas soli]|uniref:chemotaxis protein CheA n=1 Tax=Sphingomonas soli TaxID=266127 RepID=UPI000837436A|nr:chemotaxis protein CheA [Sphingomonas soli]